MNVYLVLNGKYGEETAILSAHRTKAGAIRYANQVPAIGRWWPREPEDNRAYGIEVARWASNNGVDELTVVRVAVKR